jgi:hypothetical protein
LRICAILRDEALVVVVADRALRQRSRRLRSVCMCLCVCAWRLCLFVCVCSFCVCVLPQTAQTARPRNAVCVCAPTVCADSAPTDCVPYFFVCVCLACAFVCAYAPTDCAHVSVSVRVRVCRTFPRMTQHARLHPFFQVCTLRERERESKPATEQRYPERGARLDRNSKKSVCFMFTM